MMPWNLDLGDQATIGDRVSLYALGPIRVGARATVSQNAHLCAGTHDFRRADFPLVKAPVTIGADAWICADAFVGPGVTVGDHAVVGARAVAVRSVESRAVVAGNPARVVGLR
jgi:putative colanic acid biosynthesis acetyltransferase WcaF